MLAERSIAPTYTMSAIDRVMEDLDYRSLATLLEEIAGMLEVTPQSTVSEMRE